jgi:chromosome segregation ATPase
LLAETAEKEEYAGQLKITAERLELVEEQLATARSMYDALHAEHEAGKKKLEKAELDLVHERERVEDLKQQVRKAEGDATHARQDRDRLQSKAADENAELRRSSENLIDAARNETRQVNILLNAASAEVGELKTRLSVAVAAATTEKALLAEARAEIATLHEKSHAEIERLSDQLRAKDQRMDELRNQKDSAQSRELEAARELNAVKDTLAQAQQELAVAKVTLEHSQMDKESLHTRLQDAERAVSRLEGKPSPD